MTSHRHCALPMLLLCATPLSAAEFCVTTATELQSALTTAATNGQSDHIKLAVGIYTAPSTDGFSYDAGYLPGDIGDNHALTVSGGWTEFFGNACGQQLDGTTAFQTVIDGDDRERGLQILPQNGANAHVEVRLLTFINGLTTQNGGGLEIHGPTGWLGNVRVERCAFIGNQAQFSSAFDIVRGNGVRALNNLVLSNHATHGNAVGIVPEDGPGTWFINNTVIGNTTDAGISSAIGGVYLPTPGTSRLFAANNILWDNDVADLRLLGAGVKTVRNNTIQARVGLLGDNESGNVSIAPEFDGGLFDLTLAEGSPLIDAGVKPPSIVMFPIPFDQNWSLPAVELKGATRIQGTTVDMGAYEAVATGLFANGFE